MEDLRDATQFNDNYLKLKDLSVYSGLSVRKLRDLIRDSENPLPCFRMDGLILVRRSEFDSWMEQSFRLKARDIDQIVDEVMDELR